VHRLAAAVAKKSMATAYDLIISTYYAAHLCKLPDPARYVLAQPGWLPRQATVLDYGGGAGRWAVELAARAALVVVADVDRNALRMVPSHPRLRSALVDGVTLPFRAGAFDLVFVNHVFHHVEDLPHLLPELRRVVRRGGRLIVIEFHPVALVTRIFRFLSRYRRSPCTFYPPRMLSDLVSGQTFVARHQRLDTFQYVIVAAPLSESKNLAGSPGGGVPWKERPEPSHALGTRGV
jgi:ubiquinone/menaquinone biosynthesis C-methylase UbiE